MKRAITLLLPLLFFAGCYKESGDIDFAETYGLVYPDIQLEMEWVVNFGNYEMELPWFMLETDRFVVYMHRKNLYAIDINNGKIEWVFNPTQFGIPEMRINPLMHIFEYNGHLYLFATQGFDLLKIDLSNGYLTEVIPIPFNFVSKSTPLESFFNNGRMILPRMYYDFSIHRYSMHLMDFDLNTRQVNTVGELPFNIVILSQHGRPSYTDFENNITYYKTTIRQDSLNIAVLYKFDLATHTHEAVWSMPVMHDVSNTPLFISNNNIFIPELNYNLTFYAIDQRDYTLKWSQGIKYSTDYINNNIFGTDPLSGVYRYDFDGNLLTTIRAPAYISGSGYHWNGQYVFLAMLGNTPGDTSGGKTSFTSIFDAISGQELIRIEYPENHPPDPSGFFLHDVFITKNGQNLIMQDETRIYSYRWPENF